ncbi:hypothetical protein HMPREF9333_01129 [Johnsonella ignava ATCC 51276]|jgi:hypothetical protein|uniref:Cell wall-binding repeat protein n=1 Tax=Johnsonella ignava ATCC 51276 TaxID=679200 RepID=G5GHT9_9FIRM|nr:hypothetical protein [Johnsonella ignava]EHI55782.1 hypothetical protein HMPREF9333_01129 [Johnsonella ignava ATCC 51276]
MIKKKLVCMAAVSAFVLLTAMSSFAAVKIKKTLPNGWKRDDRGWWFVNNDGSYTKNGWQWIGKRCYYFDDAGYMYENNTTPDGYTVNENGAWTVDGVVQIREDAKADEKYFNTKVTEKFGELTCITPTKIKDRGDYYEVEAVVSKGIPAADGTTEQFSTVVRVKKDVIVHMMDGDKKTDLELLYYMLNRKYTNWRMFAPGTPNVVLNEEGYITEFYDVVGR